METGAPGLPPFGGANLQGRVLLDLSFCCGWFTTFQDTKIHKVEMFGVVRLKAPCGLLSFAYCVQLIDLSWCMAS